MDQTRKGLFTIVRAFGGGDYDPKLTEMNDQHFKWQCPCIMNPCYQIEFGSVEVLIDHLREEHCLDLVHYSSTK